MNSNILRLSSTELGPRLLGMKLRVKSNDFLCEGYIVEAESYSLNHPASHTYKGQTIRNASMFKPPGTVYVYLSYGLHNCMNIVCGDSDGQAVLIRALEPLASLDVMRLRRKRDRNEGLTNGPAKLTQAQGITMSDDGTWVTGSNY